MALSPVWQHVTEFVKLLTTFPTQADHKLRCHFKTATFGHHILLAISTAIVTPGRENSQINTQTVHNRLSTTVKKDVRSRSMSRWLADRLDVSRASNICGMCLIVDLDVMILKMLKKLKKYLCQKWEAIPLREIQNLIRSMHRCCTTVVNANGGHTWYWMIVAFWKDPYVISDINSLNLFW